MENNEKTYKASDVMSMLEHINGGIEVIGEQYKEITARLDGIDVRLDKVDSRLDGIDGRLNLAQGDLTEIKNGLDEKVGREDFDKSEKRIVKLEEKFA